MHTEMPLQVARFQIDQLEPQTETQHAEYVLSFLIDGELQIHHGTPLSVRAGSAVIVPAGVPHRLLSGQGLALWWLGFCPSCLQLHDHLSSMRPFHNVRRGALPAVLIPAARRKLLTQYFAELKRLCDTPQTGHLDRSRSLLLLLLAEVDEAMTSVTNSGDRLVQAVLDYIQQHALGALSLDQVAAAVHKSPAYVTHRVKQATGAGVGEWIISHRLHQACTRLLHTRALVGDIAEQLGWKDVTHFIRLFKKRFGMTPSAWRKQHQAHWGSHSSPR